MVKVRMAGRVLGKNSNKTLFFRGRGVEKRLFY